MNVKIQEIVEFPFVFVYVIFGEFLPRYTAEKLTLSCRMSGKVNFLNTQQDSFILENNKTSWGNIQKHQIITTHNTPLILEWTEIAVLKSRFGSSLKEYKVIDADIIWWKLYYEYPYCKKITSSDIIDFIQLPFWIPILIFLIVYLRKLKKKK